MREMKFRACPILPDCYVVSSDGHVYGGKGKLKEWSDREGYPHVYLIKNGERFYRAVHKLILGAWKPKPSEKHQVNHKNGVRNDNRLENLEWVTAQENTIDGWKRGRKVTQKARDNGAKQFGGTNNPKAKITKEVAQDIRALRKLGFELKAIAKVYGISLPQISAICNNKFWKNEK